MIKKISLEVATKGRPTEEILTEFSVRTERKLHLCRVLSPAALHHRSVARVGVGVGVAKKLGLLFSASSQGIQYFYQEEAMSIFHSSQLCVTETRFLGRLSVPSLHLYSR